VSEGGREGGRVAWWCWRLQVTADPPFTKNEEALVRREEGREEGMGGKRRTVNSF